MTTIATHEIDGFGRRVAIAVSSDDIFTAPVDIIALKYAQESHRTDLEALSRLRVLGAEIDLPRPDETFVIDPRTTAGPAIAFIGTVPLRSFEYADIRQLSRLAVAACSSAPPPAAHLGMTMHGVGIGLDESEAFTAQLAGFLDALRGGAWPSALRLITVFERNAKRAQRIATMLNAVLPRKIAEQARRHVLQASEQRIESAGAGSRNKPHVFVAMPFGPETDDLFHYGIERPINGAGFLCERIDSVAFTGDILAQIKLRIDAASFVVVELSEPNANVYLELGYAWGRNVRTILVSRGVDQLRFDVQGQKCLLYSSIQQLEEVLGRELRRLTGEANGS